MRLFECPYEDTDLWCQYFNSMCKGSINCSFVKTTWWLKDKIGNLTVIDKAIK